MGDSQTDKLNKTQKKKLLSKKILEKLEKNECYFMPISDYVRQFPPFDNSLNMQGKWLQCPYEFGTQYYRLDGSKVVIYPTRSKDDKNGSCINGNNKSGSQNDKSQTCAIKLQNKSSVQSQQSEKEKHTGQEDELVCENEIGYLFNENDEKIDVERYEILLTKEYEYFIFRPKESLNIIN
ncbi:hypothetical protein ABPG74_022667 [Tetrahymena malaccensis]